VALPGAVAGDFGEPQDEERRELPCGVISRLQMQLGDQLDITAFCESSSTASNEIS